MSARRVMRECDAGERILSNTELSKPTKGDTSSWPEVGGARWGSALSCMLIYKSLVDNASLCQTTPRQLDLFMRSLTPRPNCLTLGCWHHCQTVLL